MNNKYKKNIKYETSINTKINKSDFYIAIIPALVVTLFIVFNFYSKATIAEEIMVYKSPSCGCCKKWVKHLKNQGFDVKTKDMKDVKPIKNKYGVQQKFQSCHTAKVGKYFIEGHVPAKDIKKLLKDKPDIKGLAVPGMPMGSPGMEGHRKDKYNVIAVDKNNTSFIYSSY